MSSKVKLIEKFHKEHKVRLITASLVSFGVAAFVTSSVVLAYKKSHK